MKVHQLAECEGLQPGEIVLRCVPSSGERFGTFHDAILHMFYDYTKRTGKMSRFAPGEARAREEYDLILDSDEEAVEFVLRYGGE